MDEESQGQIGDGAGAASPAPERQSSERTRRGLYGLGVRGILRVLRLANLLNSLVVVIVLPIPLIVSLGAASESKIDAFLLLAYSIVFGALLCCFEMNFTPVDRVMRRYCGFLYSYRGRAFFILFLGTLCLSADSLVNYIVGGVTLANAILNCIVIYTHPAFASGKVRGGSSDPTVAYSRGEREMIGAAKSVVQQNPDLTQRAVRAGVSAGTAYARDNPDVVRNAAGAATTQQQGQEGRQSSDEGFDTTPL